MEKLTSTSNPKIKRFALLAKARERKVQNVFIIEGFREITMAYNNGYIFKEVYFCPEVANNENVVEFVSKLGCLKYEITRAIFEKIAYRDNSDGLIVLAEPRYIQVNDLKLSSNPLVLVLESVEKPGNLGAILRTADAASVDAIFVCDPQTDIYNPNVIRSGLGCLFSKQVVICTTQEAIVYFNTHGIKTYAACLPAKKYYHETDFTGPVAIVMGTEADGLSDKWLSNSDFQVKIPMLGMADSLNVSISAAILVYEAMRQRGFKVH